MARLDPAAVPRKQGLLLFPEFPYDSFWSYRYVLRLIGRRSTFPPLGLLTFAALLPDDWDLTLIDLNVQQPSAHELRARMEAADAVFISAMSIQKRSLVQLLEGPAQGLDTPVVLGGALASSFRGQILEPSTPSDRVLHDGLDVLVWGEAEPAMPALLAQLEAWPRHREGPPALLIPEAVAGAEPGTRAYLNDRTIFRPLEPPRPPRWDLVDVHEYQSLMLQTTAGCPFRCDFCDIIQFNGGFNRPKPPATVRRELEAIFATGYRGGVFSVDDNFIGLPSAMSDILDAMIEFQHAHGYPFSFYTQASVNLGSPELEPLLERMRKAGFEAVFLGIENPDPAALRAMNKKQNLKVDIPAAVARIQAAGIEVYAGFILGGDADTAATGDCIAEFVERTSILTAMTGLLTPIPYTPLYQRLRAEGRLRAAEYSGNNTDDEVQFEPLALTMSQLKASMQHLLERLFDPQAAYARALAMVTAVRTHPFTGGRLREGYLKVGALSVWRQGIRRFDSAYFRLLWRALRLDRQLKRDWRARAHALRAQWRRYRREAPAFLAERRAWAEEMLALAYEYAVRFRPELRMSDLNAWLASARERIRTGHMSAEELRLVYRDARARMRAGSRRHRFPGAKLARAIEAAVKASHYEQVMRAIVGERRSNVHAG